MTVSSFCVTQSRFLITLNYFVVKRVPVSQPTLLLTPRICYGSTSNVCNVQCAVLAVWADNVQPVSTHSAVVYNSLWLFYYPSCPSKTMHQSWKREWLEAWRNLLMPVYLLVVFFKKQTCYALSAADTHLVAPGKYCTAMYWRLPHSLIFIRRSAN